MFADKQTVLNAFRFRHACKSYDVAKKILADDFAYILETARLSPSSFGLEPWRFLVVQNRTLREELRGIFVILLARTQATMQADYQEKIWGGAHGMPSETIGMMQKFFKQFAETNFAIADNPRAFNDWAAKQTYIALANMMTAAALIGVDSTPIEGFQKETVEKLLSGKGFINLDEYRVSVMAAFGYRAGEPRRAKTRQAAGDVVQWVE
ncbi:NAD(P)H-dependent oxidoreductase [Eikenella corrodens]|uniref:nitroreductase family protein n=1 Tax=Eikenella corrodens TaxID=539 RepID=UPI0007D08EDC|nr:nitroreductase family protein [Eikenella corrodens]OAM21319.1 NAD(P)H-dependent oxidoreductase [Eikenella corrodens]